jgi:hypothetical protein
MRVGGAVEQVGQLHAFTGPSAAEVVAGSAGLTSVALSSGVSAGGISGVGINHIFLFESKACKYCMLEFRFLRKKFCAIRSCRIKGRRFARPGYA